MAASGEGDTKLSKSQAALAGELRERMADSLLPGEAAFSAGRLADAAGFLFDAARVRDDQAPSIVLLTAPGSHFMRLAVVNDDMPFLVDSVAAAIAAEGLTIDQLVHPIVPVERDSAGRLTAIPEDGNRRESMIYVEMARTDGKDRRKLEKALATTLADVRAAVADWPKMTERMSVDADRVDDPEGAAAGRLALLALSSGVGAAEVGSGATSIPIRRMLW